MDGLVPESDPATPARVIAFREGLEKQGWAIGRNLAIDYRWSIFDKEAATRMQLDHLKRREIITVLGGAAAWPLAARAQQLERMRRIGVLMGFPESDPEAHSELISFVQELQKLGWAEGRNLRTDTRWWIPVILNTANGVE
jgi:hypothetical protein